MFRSFIPFFLASLGFILFVPTVTMPLFEWQISEVVEGSASVCSGDLPSSLITTVGESLDLSNNPYLSKDLSFVVRSSPSGMIIEGITRHIDRNIIPLLWLHLFVCGIYVGWSANYHKRTMGEIIIAPLVAFLLTCLLINAGRLFYPYLGSLLCLQGEWNAELSRIHYGTLLVLFAAFLAEVGSIVVMASQIRQAIIPEQEPVQSVVG